MERENRLKEIYEKLMKKREEREEKLKERLREALLKVRKIKESKLH
ncbi:MAG: hypothetical protein N3D10_03555 [Candidatus Micrarchaeota archaeon]|nr:hypothetical protein [Candidatus Micrarchaeota archaeon]